MDFANTAIVSEPIAAAGAGQDQRWRAWQAQNAAIERVNRQRRMSVCLYVMAAAALLSAFWMSFGGAL